MALTKCRECGKEVSTEALTCPHCGAPRVRATKSTSPWTVIGWLILILIGIWFWGAVKNEMRRQEALTGGEPVKEATVAVPIPPPYHVTVQSFRCEQRGSDMRAEVTLVNDGHREIPVPKIYFTFGQSQEDSLFDPINIPQGSRATAFARSAGRSDCGIAGMQDKDGNPVVIDPPK